MSDASLHKQDTDFDILNTIIPHLTHRSFIDIGAEKGSFAELLIKQGLPGVLFEPLPKHESELKSLVVNTNNVFLNFAIDSIDRTADFHIACDENDQPLDFFHSLQPLTN